MPNIDPLAPTIDNVAARAGVSTATVSRVLNKPQSVSDGLRQRVQDAIAQLGYVPRASARALMLGRTGTIGAVFPTVDNAIFAQAINALQRRLDEFGHQLLIATSGYDQDNETRQAMNLVTRGVDAIALCGLCQSDELIRFLQQRGLPAVHVMIHPQPHEQEHGRSLSIGVDNAAAMGQATRYLLDLGHRRIAMIAGITHHNDRATQRLAGVRDALAAADLGMPSEYVLERAYRLSDARDAMRSLMNLAPAPTAVICGNDLLAHGALLEAAHLGLQVPQQVSIVGFDDLELSRHIRPSLTTIRVPTDEMWSLAADRLLASLGGQPAPLHTEMDVALVVRQSTGPAP